MPEEIDQPLLSRTGCVSPIGTLTEPLATKVDADTEEAFRRICAESGTDVAGALRNYVCKVVHGKTFDQLVHEAAQRRRLALGLEGANGLLIGSPAEAHA
jgi:hypothetical protein